jgi:hypothetical protein
VAVLTTVLSLRKPDPADFINHVTDLNANWDLVDALFNTSTGHKHTGAGTNGPTVTIDENGVLYDASEASTNDTLSGASKLINNMNRLRYWITQISGVSWTSAITESLNTHRTNTTTFHGTTGFQTNTIALGTVAAAGAATGLIRADATIAAFDATSPSTAAYGDAAVVGVINFAARRDHKHGMPASSVTYATPAVLMGVAAAAGAASTVIRSDATIAAFDATVVSASAVGDAATTGAINFAARRDHVHAREAYGGTPAAVAVTAVTGVGTGVPHNDHAHAHGSLATIANAHAAADITNAAALNAIAAFTKQYYATKFTVSFSTTPTFDWNNSNVQYMSMTGNITAITLNNPGDGGRYQIIFKQDGTGSRTIVGSAWPASVLWTAGNAPVLSTVANKVDIIGFTYDATNSKYYGTMQGNY